MHAQGVDIADGTVPSISLMSFVYLVSCELLAQHDTDNKLGEGIISTLRSKSFRHKQVVLGRRDSHGLLQTRPSHSLAYDFLGSLVLRL